MASQTSRPIWAFRIMPVYRLFDVGSTYTKGLIVDTDHETILASASDFTTADSDIVLGIETVTAKMMDQGTIAVDQTLVCSSAKGGLRMIAVGLVPDLTLKAATLACYSAGAKVIRSYAFELNQSEVLEIQNTPCDILLLVGGTDGGNTEVVLHNARMIAAIHPSFPILYAGNKSVLDDVVSIFELHQVELLTCANVMPEYGVLNVEDCRARIRELFLKSIVKAKGLSELSAVIDDIVLPTPYSVMEALSLLAKGTNTEKGWGDLMAVDVGGATTDVYSMNSKFVLHEGAGYKGLKEPLEKRSVEGDLGVRLSALHVLDHMKDDPECDEALHLRVQRLAKDVRAIDDQADAYLARWCVRLASRRHAGRLESAYTPMGMVLSQSGKDLSLVKTIIGIGGPLIHSKDPKAILAEVLCDPAQPEILLPKALDRYLLDKSYIVSCLGLLASRHPDQTLRLLKKHLENCP